jgi:hypothetical protein
MGVFDQELILPGTITEIVSDYSFGYDTSKFGTTDSVTLIGTAFNGPVGKPVEIYSPEHARYIFGGTYDYKTRREATLVAGIQDAWDRGCRTIYAVRVSGKDIYKDFQLAIDTKLKLRLSGIFPSNDNKDIYFVYDDTVGAQTLKVYKPAKRATIQEKMMGLVEREESVLVTSLDISNSYGLTKDDRLSEFIKIVNDHSSNNVLRLSIVDENGSDVTISSKEAQALSLGAMFPGAYFIGRDVNKVAVATDLSVVVATEIIRPYADFTGMLFKKLSLNTDINADLPIYAETVSELSIKFAGILTMNTMWDFLAVPGKADQLFGKDSIDYEEVDITDFDLYKRLGAGYAVTAKAENVGASSIKIKETPVSDDNRVLAIQDGIYSMLENLKSDYRILASAVADTPISGKIPKKDAFYKATPVEYSIFDNKIVAKAKLDKNISAAKQYKFNLSAVPSDYVVAETAMAKLYTDQVVKHVTKIAAITEVEGKTFANGTLFMLMTVGVGTLYRYANGKLTKLEDSTLYADLIGKMFMIDSKVYVGTQDTAIIEFVEVAIGAFGTNEYLLVESGGTISVFSFDKLVAPLLVPVGALSEVFSDNDDKTLVTVQSVDLNVNTITVKSSVLDFTTLEEFVEILNGDSNLAQYFEFSIAAGAVLEKDEYVADPLSTPLVTLPVIGVAAVDRTFGYDTSLYIPYKTTDNFARHLAQHCTYTSLKTAPTHGIMGVSKLLDVNLTSVANKVSHLIELDFNLNAKKPNGKDMLDRNNLPYPIGRNISVVVGQYIVNNGDGYNYISNSAAGYAGMISILPLDQSSTSQPIAIPNPMYELTNYQLERLTQKGYITFKQSYTRGFVITDGITMAPVTSPFRRLSVTRIINAIEEVIRAAIEPFIGKQNHLANRNSMQTAVKSELEKLKGKLIEGYDFKLVVDPASLKLGIVEIDYNIVPIYEIREVRNRISIKESL